MVEEWSMFAAALKPISGSGAVLIELIAYLPRGLIGLLIAYSATQTGAIRVYWNTNTGPIVPPTTTPVPVPQPPFRDPAPVWEDQSDDVPNPNPYV
ncbi:AAEL000133-PA [Aedes aegypti]|uniref:AAEL000133-PA n=1 Tax=Aedes aegypti TaxID=7159 RepID=Q17Q66_AEDAE|nr:AAEL000133-PA [Aedes aegypti]